MPGLMVWPRRSCPCESYLITPMSAPCGRLVRVTSFSLFGGPEGVVLRSHTSHNTPLGPLIFAPSFCSVSRTGAGTSEGGGPAGSVLYCPKPTAAQAKKTSASREIRHGAVIEVQTPV